MNFRRGSIFGAVLLASALLITAGLSATASAADPGVLVRQDANLTIANRATGMPTTPSPHRHLASARIGVEAYGQGTPEPSYFIKADIRLEAEPSADPDAELNLGFGHRSGSSCELAAVLAAETSDYKGTRYEFVGYNPDYFPTPSRPWDCVAVYLDNGFSQSPPTATYDAFVAPLIDTRKSPRLSIRKVDLLGQKVKTLRLVRGVPTRIGIDFRNSGKVSTGKLTARGSGKGLRVPAQKTNALGSERDGSVSLAVRLTGRQKKTTLKIVIGDGKSRAVRKLRVVRVKPPPRPVPGSYRSPSGDVRFSVKRGRIVGWYGTMTTRCGGFPEPFTYSTNSYSFPTRKVPRNGILQAQGKGSLYTVSLRLRFAGRKVTRGLFIYYGPARCYASVNFKAKRTGR